MRENSINQVCTASDLIEGNYENSYPVSDILKHNDFGLGTFNLLNGEMIIYDGHIFRAKSYGSIERVVNDKSPLIIATKFNPDFKLPLKESNKSKTEEYIASKLFHNSIYAIKIEGFFPFIDLRSSSPISKPYPSFEKVMKNTTSYSTENIDGIIVGFYFPKSFEKISTSGFHFHFIDQKKELGGHVVDFKIKKATISINRKSNFNLSIPKPDY